MSHPNTTVQPLPALLEPAELAAMVDRGDIIIVDTGRAATYANVHIPGAVHLNYNRLVAGTRPAPGQLPPPGRLSRTLTELGVSPNSQVVAYDDEGGANAARLLWTLDVIGHRPGALLNGGLHAWANEGHPLEHTPNTPVTGDCTIQGYGPAHADMQTVNASLNNPDAVLWDTRSAKEYSGLERYSARGGHIPGAINLEWVHCLDINRNMRLQPEARLHALMTAQGLSPCKHIIVYCQRHHRAAHSYWVLKTLGYPRISGYAGAWAEWGNDHNTPIASAPGAAIRP